MNYPIDPRRKEEREKILRGLETQNDSSILWDVLRRNRTDMSAQLKESEYLPLDLSELKVLAQSIGIEAWLSIEYDEEKLQKAAKDTQRILLSQRELPIDIKGQEEIAPDHKELIQYITIRQGDENPLKFLRTLKEWESLIEKLPNLQYVYLDHTYSSSSQNIASTLSWSKELGLSIRGVNLRNGDHRSFDEYDLSKICNLSAYSSNISSEALKKLITANQLKTLNLTIDNGSSEEHIDSLSQLPIQVLSLGSFGDDELLNDDLCQKLSRSKTLENIQILSQCISPIGAERLLSLPHLRSLSLHNPAENPFSKEEIHRLQQIRPDVDLYISNS